MFSLSDWTVWQRVDTDVVVVQRFLRRWHIRQHVGCDVVELRRLVLTGVLLPARLDDGSGGGVSGGSVQHRQCVDVQIMPCGNVRRVVGSGVGCMQRAV